MSNSMARSANHWVVRPKTEQLNSKSSCSLLVKQQNTSAVLQHRVYFKDVFGLRNTPLSLEVCPLTLSTYDLGIQISTG